MNWHYAYTPQIWPSIVTVVLLISLGVYAWRRRNLPGALVFAVYCLFGVAFLAPKIPEFLAVGFQTKVLWFNVQYPWLMPGTTALTCFVLEYAWPGRWLQRRTVALLSVVPLLALALLVTNDFHHLLFRDYDFNGDVVPLYGPAGWTFLVYNLGLRAVSIAALAWLFVHSPHHRLPAVLIMTAEAVVGVALILDPYIEESQFFYIPEKALPVVACAIALFGYRIFAPIPLAHRTAIEQTPVGMIVLDNQERVISLNPSGERVLNTPAKQAEGKPIRELLPSYPEVHRAESGETEIELTIGEGPSLRYYMLANSLLHDFRELEVGRLLRLRDVTEQKRAQEQILEQQRALSMLQERERLARELHDNLAQVFAFVNVQGQAIRRLLGRGDLSTADEYVGRLLEVAREADVDVRESIMGLRATTSEERLLPTLTRYLAKYEKTYGIKTRLEGSEPCTDGAFDPLVEVQLLRILQEALTNVRKHASARSVRIAFVFEDGRARVTVHDDGRGFEPDAPPDGMEEHVGLHVMRERAEEVGGSLSVQSATGQGTELVVCVPVKGANRA